MSSTETHSAGAIKSLSRGLNYLFLLLLLAGGLPDARGKPAAQSEGPKFKKTGARLLSTESPTKDEDPSLIRALDGTLFVVWFSDRGGNADIYITSTRNGKDWAPPVRVTTSTDGDFAPNLFQDDQGTFHLVWFRWSALFRGHIWYNSSPDGLTWDQRAERQITAGEDVDDWVPTITQAPDGTLLVFFVSDKRDAVNPTNELYVTTKHPADVSWSPAAPVAGINSATEHDHLPYAARTGMRITLVWVRHDISEILPWLNPKSDLFYATSSEGLTWSAPSRITNESGNVVNLFPSLFQNLAGDWFLVWLSNKSGLPRVFDLSLSDADLYPLGLGKNRKLSAGYSHRIAPTSTPGVYLGVWVEGQEGAQDIYYRFFKKK